MGKHVIESTADLNLGTELEKYYEHSLKAHLPEVNFERSNWKMDALQALPFFFTIPSLGMYAYTGSIAIGHSVAVAVVLSLVYSLLGRVYAYYLYVDAKKIRDALYQKKWEERHSPAIALEFLQTSISKTVNGRLTEVKQNLLSIQAEIKRIKGLLANESMSEQVQILESLKEKLIELESEERTTLDNLEILKGVRNKIDYKIKNIKKCLGKQKELELLKAQCDVALQNDSSWSARNAEIMCEAKSIVDSVEEIGDRVSIAQELGIEYSEVTVETYQPHQYTDR